MAVKEKTEVRKAHHPYATKKNMVQRLKRIEGQVRGLARMIDEDVYCDDILHQFASVQAAIDGVKKTLLDAHVRSCVVEQIADGRLEVVDELMATIGKMSR